MYTLCQRKKLVNRNMHILYIAAKQKSSTFTSCYFCYNAIFPAYSHCRVQNKQVKPEFMTFCNLFLIMCFWKG